MKVSLSAKEGLLVMGLMSENEGKLECFVGFHDESLMLMSPMPFYLQHESQLYLNFKYGSGNWSEMTMTSLEFVQEQMWSWLDEGDDKYILWKFRMRPW